MIKLFFFLFLIRVRETETQIIEFRNNSREDVELRRQAWDQQGAAVLVKRRFKILKINFLILTFEKSTNLKN